MLRRLPRALARAGSLRAEVAAVQALHSSSRVLPLTEEASVSSRAALVASAFAATTLLSATTLAEQAPVAAAVAAPKDPADTLKSLKSLGDAKEIILYQYEVCPFCNKLRAYLDYHKIPYKVVEVNPLTKKEIKWSTYTKVPVLVVDGEQLNDSKFIIKALDAKLRAGGGRRNPRLWRAASADAQAEEDKWFSWVDGRFVHVLTPNIYRTVAEAKQTFNYITDKGNFGFVDRELARWSGVAIMYTLTHTRLKKRHGITDERKALYEEVNNWTAALGSRNFMGGDTPNLADIAFFGVLRAVEGFDTHKDVMANTTLEPWYTRMKAMVGTPSRLTA